ncbi:MAG: COR domain-containing protein [Planctomycetota bacterium]
MAKQQSDSDRGYAKALERIASCRKAGDKSLSLVNLELGTLPPEIGQLTTLTTLNLGGDQLSTLPPEIGQLAALTTLELSGNQLSTLPPEIGQFTALTVLDLLSSQLTALPPEIGQLTALTELDLRDNQLRTLPSEIRRLTALSYLNLGGNRLSTLPSEIGQLTALTEFYCFECELSTLPPEIGQLTALTTLYLRENQLSTLPPEIGRLSRLEQLILEDNQLRELPESLRELRQLKELALHGNEALELPNELLGPKNGISRGSNPPADPRAILDYYFSRQLEGEEPMREVRLLLVGRGRVGKTSLLKALRSEQPNEKEPETPGITVQPLELNCVKGTAIGHVWDFGGQEFLHGTHQIFLAERCVYLLVLEGRESNWEMETDYWLRFIQSFGGDSPVVVVLTKYDAHPFSVDRFRLQERCPQVAGFVETDAFTGRGIRELTELLAKMASEMKDVWLGVPKKWHQVKQRLTEMPQSFLEYKDYQALCQQTGVDDAGKQDSLAQTLHRLGIALNFRDHHRLRQTSVLKPKWVTEAIYGLIRYVQKQDCHGVLQQPWMEQALDPVDYPADKHPFVLELMEKFEVAFPLEGTQDWLIPELLREEQPAPFTEFRGPGVRRLRFSYPDALPPGLLPRFIVRTHEMSAAHPDWRWRSGVVLEWQGARALVRLNRLERRTDVAVIEGPADDQQSLFDLIRAHLTVLHGKVRAVEEVELEGHPDTWVRVGKLRLLEAEGTQEIKEETNEGELATVHVTETLDGVESPEAREADWAAAPRRMRLFVSYSHADVKKIAPLSTHLTILGQRGYIQVWQDTQLIAGEEWEDRIVEELDRADIVLYLHSDNSCASSFIQKTEAPKAVQRAQDKQNACTLIVVPLDREGWDETVPLERELKKLQTATWNARPVLKFAKHKSGWQQVERSIRDAVELRRKGIR